MLEVFDRTPLEWTEGEDNIGWNWAFCFYERLQNSKVEQCSTGTSAYNERKEGENFFRNLRDGDPLIINWNLIGSRDWQNIRKSFFELPFGGPTEDSKIFLKVKLNKWVENVFEISKDVTVGMLRKYVEDDSDKTEVFWNGNKVLQANVNWSQSLHWINISLRHSLTYCSWEMTKLHYHSWELLREILYMLLLDGLMIILGLGTLKGPNCWFKCN